MNGLLRRVLIAGLLSPVAVLAGEKIDKSLDADADSVVTISNVRGEVSIEGWQRNEVKVEGELDDLAESFEFERSGKVVKVEVRMPRRDIHSGDGSRLRLRVPQGSRLEFKGISSSVNVDGVEGGVEARTISGDIRLRKVGAGILLKSVSGDMSIEGSTASTRLKSVSGDIRATLQSPELALSTVSGDIELEMGDIEMLTLNSVSGDIEVSGALRETGRLEIRTVSGDSMVKLNGKVNARANLQTGPGGSIVNKLSDAGPEESFPAQERLETSFGNGSALISVNTISGEITLE